jgi:hypothetical protein
VLTGTGASAFTAVAFSVFLFTVALCLRRAPEGGRLHVSLCTFSAALWCDLLLNEPATRNSIFGFTASSVLWAASRLHRYGGPTQAFTAKLQ